MATTDYTLLADAELIKSHKPYCLECGKEMTYGRPDRKFCCKSCKNKYHNRPVSRQRNLKMRIQHILEKNYVILSAFLKSGITAVPMTNLMVMGFNPLYFTGSMKQQGKGLVCMCFNIRYTQTPNKIYQMEYVETIPA